MTRKALPVTILDKFGTPYCLRITFDTSTYLEFHVWHKNKWVGLIRCEKHGREELYIGEITIFEKAIWIEPWWLQLLRFIFRRPQPVLDYRGKGIGVAVIDFLKDYAQSRRIRCITGFIRSESMPTSVLINWYQRQGFTVDTDHPNHPFHMDLTK